MDTIPFTLKSLQDIVNVHILEHGGYWPPLSMLAAVMEELGELSRELNSIEGPKKKRKKAENDNSEKSPLKHVEEELGDLLYSLICLFNYYEIDAESAITWVLQKYDQRDRNRFTRPV